MSLGKMQEAYKVNGNMKGIEFTTWITERGEVLREESPMGFLLVKESKEDALKIARPSLDLLSQAAVPFKIRLPPDISYLKVRLTGISFTGLDMDGGRQKLIGDVLEINREVIDSRMKTRNTKIRGKTFDEYLNATIFIQSKDPQIKGLAREIIKDEKDPLVAARLIYDWVYKNIKKVPTITIPMATDVLKTKKGDCNEHTTLFTALARASGIPAKIAVGLIYKDGFFYYHAWPEIYAGQWLAVDPTLGQFSADASHIRLITGDIDRQTQVLPVINRIRIEGLEYR
jgi:transglutaminase-like putative cysteine protease